MQATSQQTSDGTIYVVGGYRSQASGELTVLNDCMSIDANLHVFDRSKMKTPRFGAVLALVRERYLLSISGNTNAGAMTRKCEAFDT